MSAELIPCLACPSASVHGCGGLCRRCSRELEPAERAHVRRRFRQQADLPLCRTGGCAREPMRVGARGLCRPCYDAAPHPRREVVGLEKLIRERAALEGLSRAQWVRRALVEKLAQTPAKSGSVSGGPST